MLFVLSEDTTFYDNLYLIFVLVLFILAFIGVRYIYLLITSNLEADRRLDEVRSKEQELRDKEKKLNRLSLELKAEQEKKAKSTSTGIDLSKTVDAQKKEIDRLCTKVKNLESQIKPIDAVRKECEAEQRQLEFEHDRVVSHLEKQLADARKLLPSALPLKSLDTAKREWEAEQRKKDAEKDNTIANQRQTINKQKKELEDLQQKYSAALQDNSRLKSQSTSPNQNNVPPNARTNDLQYVENLKSEIRSLKMNTDTDAMSKMLQAARNGWEVEQNYREKDLKEKIVSLKNELAQAKANSANLQSRRQELAQEKAEFDNDKNRFQKERDAFNKEKRLFEQTCESYISEKSEFDMEKSAFDQKEKQFVEIFEAVKSAADLKGTPYNSALSILHILRDPKSIPKFDKACSGTITPITPLIVSCQIQPSDSQGNPYTTTLTSCTCRSFTGGRIQSPCKHMIWLALRMGAYVLSENDRNRLVMELKEKTDDYILAFDNFKQESKKQEKKEQKLNEKIEIIRSAEIRHPELARILSSYDMYVEQCREKILKTKKNPAIRAADTIQEVNQETSKLRKEFNMIQAQLDFYETYFPWLQHFLDLPIDMARKCASEIKADGVIADHIMSHFNDYSA